MLATATEQTHDERAADDKASCENVRGLDRNFEEHSAKDKAVDYFQVLDRGHFGCFLVGVGDVVERLAQETGNPNSHKEPSQRPRIVARSHTWS